MSRALISWPGTGGHEGVAGVKTAKLCAEQDQIGSRLSGTPMKTSGRSLEGHSNVLPRGMTVAWFATFWVRARESVSEPMHRIRLTAVLIPVFVGLGRDAWPHLFVPVNLSVEVLFALLT